MYYLELEYDNKVISIPFGKLKDIDKYTMKYKDRKVFLNKLISILELDIDIDFVNRMYLVKEEDRLCEFDYETCLPIRYSNDNYDIDSLRDNFISYLQQDHSRIRMFDVIYVKLPWMMDFRDGKKDISNDEIKLAVNTYFKDNYKGIRKVYFDIKDECKIKKGKFELSDKKIEREELSKLESNKDDYLQYLIELSSRSDEDRLRATYELSLMPMEDLVRIMSRGSGGVLDGLSDLGAIKNDEVLELEMLVGMNIEDIRKIARKSLGHKR